jgi:hypothetical protein
LGTPRTKDKPPRTGNGTARKQSLAKSETIGIIVEAMPAIIHGTEYLFLIFDRTQIPVFVVEMDG